ncbi:hypothetical protein [Phaeobacter sp. NW0010-22]|uniref:hypothetical protein n=1 Tax=Phaeobacter sp. NW0010-22 TaxID=3135907 RepID=UPI00310341A4
MSGPKPDHDPAQPTPFGVYDQPKRQMVTGIEIVAILLSVLWLGGALAYFFVSPPQQPAAIGVGFLVTMLAVFMPVAMIWVAATAARSSRVMREESHRLQAAIDAIRHAYVTQQQRATIGQEPSVAKKLDEIAETARKTETTLATFSTKRREPVRPASQTEQAADVNGDQGSLELGTPAETLSPPLPSDDFIRALNFPETAEDIDGFSALRRALKDRKAAQLIQAAQDILTLLSQDGIYMDDLRPDLSRPEVWRQFAQGTRGRAVAALGGVRDRSSLALTAGRMKQDPIFRDAAHHFLRRFDQMFTEFEPEASDEEISALSDTRTARAFMLLGRVAGTFD